MLISRLAGRADKLVPLNPAVLRHPGVSKLLLMKKLQERRLAYIG